MSIAIIFHDGSEVRGADASVALSKLLHRFNPPTVELLRDKIAMRGNVTNDKDWNDLQFLYAMDAANLFTIQQVPNKS